MTSYLGVLNSDQINRDGYRFTVGALEQAMFDNALDGMPSLISHDFHRPLGWVFPYGLYFEPKITKTIGNFFLCENEEDYKNVNPRIQNHLSKINFENCKDFIEEFKTLLDNNFSDEGSFYLDNSVVYSDTGILNRIYPNLHLLIDKDGLFYLDDLLRDFEYIGSGVFKNKKDPFAIYCHQFFKRSLSRFNNFNTYFIDEFISLKNDKNLRLRIALDDNIIGLTKTYSGSLELDYWWGPKFTNDISLISDGVTRYECDERDKFFSGVLGTEFWWKSDENEKTLEIEEIRENASLGISKEEYGCRYIHSIYDTTKDEFIHFDGAIRLYNEEKILKRWESSINKAGKDTDYTKIFRIDGKLKLSDWKKLSILYYHGNPLIYEYFGVKEEFEALTAKAKFTDDFKKIMPYHIESNQGLRLFISYHNPKETEDSFERQIINTDVIRYSNDNAIDIAEYDILEIKKILNRMGEHLHFPQGISFIKPFDFYTNFPTILHSSNNTEILIQKSLEAYETLFSIQNSTMNKTVSLSFAWLMENKLVTLSIFGKISEVQKWLNENKKIPIDHSKFRIWLEKQNKWLSSNYEYFDNEEYNILKPDGVQYIKRKPINQQWIKDLHEDEEGLKYQIEIPATEQEIMKLTVDKRIFPTQNVLLKKIVCSKTKENYITSSTSKFLDDDVQMLIEEIEFLGFFWTDKQYY